MAKRGRMSDEEKLFLDQYLESKSDKQLSLELDRTIDFVSKYRKSKPHTERTEAEDEIVTKLYNLYFWKEIKTQISTEELRSFESRWVVLNKQFQDILPTDQMQMKDLIILEILINRVLTEKHGVLSTIDRLGKQLKREEDKPIEFQDTNLMLNIETQLNAAMASQNSRTTEHMKLQEKKDAKFKDLKATRDQRFKQLEDSRKSFFDLMKILDEKDSREKEGRQIELMKLSSKKKAKELGKYTEYDDGTVDRPLLNMDTAGEDEDE